MRTGYASAGLAPCTVRGTPHAAVHDSYARRVTSPSRTLNRDILRLAVPALGLARRRAAVPDRRLRAGRPPRGHAARRPRASPRRCCRRSSGSWCSSPTRPLPPSRAGSAPATRPGRCRSASTACGSRSASARSSPWPATSTTPFLVGLFGATPEVARRCRDLPRHLDVGPARDAHRLRRHRPAARHAGHRDAAVDRRARLRRERAAQLAVHLRLRLGHRRLRVRHGRRAVGHGRRLRRRDRQARPHGTRHPSARSARACAARRARAAGCSCARCRCGSRCSRPSSSRPASAPRSSPAGRSRSRSSRPPRSPSTRSRSPPRR